MSKTFHESVESMISENAVNQAPTGADKTITTKEDWAYKFTAADFGFSDVDGNQFAGILIDSGTHDGFLSTGRGKVNAGDVVSVSDLDALVWTPHHNAFGIGAGHFSFKVIDDGGTEGGGQDTAQVANVISFDLSDVVDVIKGTSSNDTRIGTSGNDFFNGMRGDDLLTGSGGADKFLFGTHSAKDIITDFAPSGDGHDIIDLSKLSSIRDYSDLESHFSEHHGNLWIDAGNGDILVLRHLQASDLDQSDFIF